MSHLPRGTPSSFCRAIRRVEWDAWVADYAIIRDAIEETCPEVFKDFNKRMFKPGGFWKGNKASERIWLTKSGKAEFLTPSGLSAAGFDEADGRYRLMTSRSNDQFNTTIYGHHDRFRRVKGRRDMLFMNEKDITSAGLHEGQIVALESAAEESHVPPAKTVPVRIRA